MSRSIIITGASSGIGKTTAIHFLQNGWRVGLIGRRRDALEETAHEGGGDSLVLSCDVTDEVAVVSAFARAHATWGHLDCLFNNAGGGLIAKLIDEVSYDDWKAIVDININGMFLCAREAFKHMRQQNPQGGRIINNGSISAHVPRPQSMGYTTTKHAVQGMTSVLALDGRPYNIACGQIDIGNAESQMTKIMSQGILQADLSTKVEPVMDVKHVAESVMHMANLPLDANVLSMTVMATNMPYVGRG